MTDTCLGFEGMGFNAASTYPCPQNGNASSPPIVLWGHLLSVTWLPPFPKVQLRQNWLIGWNGCRNIFGLPKMVGHSGLTLQAGPGHVLGEFLAQLPHAHILLFIGEYTGCNCKLPPPVNFFCHLEDFWIRGPQKGLHGGVFRGQLGCLQF